MKIAFVLPKVSRYVVGGYKIIFEYANRLVKRGHLVEIIYLNDELMEKYQVPQLIKDIIGNYEVRKQPTWFPLSKEIKKIGIHEKQLFEFTKNYEYIVATSYDTAVSVNKLKGNFKKVYFIQGYETWRTSEENIRNSYAFGMQNIVISTWLQKIVEEDSKTPVICIPNAIDTDIFKVIRPIEERNEHSIGVLYHKELYKGLKYSFKSIDILKERYSDLKVYMFGTTAPNFELPNWFSFKMNVSPIDLNFLYNNCSVFMCSSINDGFGLTGAESMACGCAYASSAYKGVFEYAINGENALISPIRDPLSMANNISVLFDDPRKRIEIAKNGVETIKKRSWSEAITLFENSLENLK